MVSDRPGVPALERAREAGIHAEVVGWDGDRHGFTEAVCGVVEASGAELMVLAGFMRILGPEAVRRFPGRILNIHPSLLPAFPGTVSEAVGGAIEYGVKVTGVTVHVVDEQVDHGPIVAQVPVEVRAGDTVDTLHARIQAEEHRIYPEVVAAFARGDVTIEGRAVRSTT